MISRHWKEHLEPWVCSAIWDAWEEPKEILGNDENPWDFGAHFQTSFQVVLENQDHRLGQIRHWVLYGFG